MRGVVYYNRGKKMIARLAVSLSSLRKVYAGPVTVLSEDNHEPTEMLARIFGVDVQRVEYPKTAEKRATYLNATLTHLKTPYETTVWLDSDTLIKRDFPELFAAAEEHEFAIAQLADWETTGRISKRIHDWEPLYPEWIQPAINFGPAINCGVFAFHKSSLMRDWWGLAEKGRELSWIPDETCCQLILPQYPHKIMPHWFNVSCKYDDVYSDEARIVHYHGRKHCRIEDGNPVYGADLWFREFDEVRNLVDDFVRDDRQLRKNLKAWDKLSVGK